MNSDFRFGTDYSFFEELVARFVDWTPYLVGLLLYVVFAFLIYKLIIVVAAKLFERVKPEEIVKKWLPSLEIDKININFSTVLLSFLRIALLMLFVVFGAELFGMDILSSQISMLMSYLPRVVVAFVLVVFSLGLSASVSKLLNNILFSLGIAGAKLISRVASFLLIFVIVLIAIEVLGIDTSIITTNMSIILGAFMGAITLGVGIGSVELVRRIFFGFYLKKHLKIGQKIQMNDITGTIQGIDGISVIVRGSEETYIIPIRQMVDTCVKILE